MTWQSAVLRPALPKEVFHQGGKTLVGVFKVQATQLVVKTRCTATLEELRTTLLEAAFVGTAGSVFASTAAVVRPLYVGPGVPLL